MQKAPSRHVPAVVKRAVWLRDLGRCAFVGAGGQRCSLRPGWRSLRRRDPVTLPGATTITRAGCISGGAAPAANLFRNKLAWQPHAQGWTPPRDPEASRAMPL